MQTRKMESTRTILDDVCDHARNEKVEWLPPLSLILARVHVW